MQQQAVDILCNILKKLYNFHKIIVQKIAFAAADILSNVTTFEILKIILWIEETDIFCDTIYGLQFSNFLKITILLLFLWPAEHMDIC